MSTVSAKILIERLRGEENTHRSEFIHLAVEHTLALPLNVLIDSEMIAQVITEALTDVNAEQLVDAELHPLLDRLLLHFERTDETPRDLLPENTSEQLIKIVSKGPRPEVEWAKGAVDPAPIRGLIAPIVQDMLLSFTKKLPIPGLGSTEDSAGASSRSSRSRGRLGKALRKSAGSIADMSKAAIGGLGSELERKIQATTREFSNQALGEVRSAIQARLKTKEGQEVIRMTRIALTERFLDTPVHVILEDVYRLPLNELTTLIPPISEHNRSRTQLRAFIEAEVTHHLEKRGDESVGDLLDEYHLREVVSKHVIEKLDTPVASFIESDGFEAWLENLLKG